MKYSIEFYKRFLERHKSADLHIEIKTWIHWESAVTQLLYRDFLEPRKELRLYIIGENNLEENIIDFIKSHKIQLHYIRYDTNKMIIEDLSNKTIEETIYDQEDMPTLTFINELCDMYQNKTINDDIIIDLEFVSKWLKVPKFELHKTLKKSYVENVDYTIKKGKNPKENIDKRANNYKKVLVSFRCFKNMTMLSHSKNSKEIRNYFIEIEKTLLSFIQE